MTPAYFFDIDGTLADCSHRLHHILSLPKDWKSFFAACADDSAIAHTVKLAQDLAASGATIVYLSGRSDECVSATIAWIFHAGLPRGRLYMRPRRDHRDDDILKIEMMNQARTDGFEPIMVFEDRKRCVDMWRANGIPCAQVAPGDF